MYENYREILDDHLFVRRLFLLWYYLWYLKCLLKLCSRAMTVQVAVPVRLWLVPKFRWVLKICVR